MTGWPLPKALDRGIVFCNQIVADIASETVRPEYIVQDQFICSEVRGQSCFKLCHKALLGLEKDGQKLYSVENEYHDIHIASEVTRDDSHLIINHPTFMYKLNSAFAPI